MSKILKYRILLFFKQFFLHYIANYFINLIPFYFLRNLYYKILMGLCLGEGSSIHMKAFIEGANPLKKRFKMGKNSSIGRESFLDLRGGIEIGDNVSISPSVKIITAQHIIDSKKFDYIAKKVVIKDYVWIGTNAMIMPGVTVEKGAVIAAGSVVVKNVNSYEVVGGNPAKKIKDRIKQLDYNVKYFPFFD